MKYKLWLDLETTGLIPSESKILEIGILITKEDVDNDTSKIVEQKDFVIYNPSPIIPDRKVREMHVTNGLLEDCRDSSCALKLHEALDKIISIMNKYKLTEDVMLWGQSVHFDLEFIKYHLPILAKRLSHRVGNVSTIMDFMEEQWWADWKTVVKATKKRFNYTHRALEDVMFSWAIYQEAKKYY